jgi:hypothetical protein
MRILVGTLRTVENEFEQCCDSIQKQSYGAKEHLVLSDLPNREAHITLFRTFMDRADDFDLLVKIDADMVLCRDDLFANLVDYFRDHPQIHRYSIAVHDFFTDRLIMGMNVYRNTLRWVHDDSIFVENSSLLRLVGESGELVPLPIGSTINDMEKLAPAAVHCADPSEFQAFHFGVHKGLKVRESIDNRWQARGLEHFQNLSRTWRHFCEKRHRTLLVASLGGECALRGDFNAGDLPYTNPHVAEVFAEQFAGKSDRDLERIVRKLRRQNRILKFDLWRIMLQDSGLMQTRPGRVFQRTLQRARRLASRLRNPLIANGVPLAANRDASSQ